eukprot:922635-Pyramimonas_sp.AAC.1
MVGYPAALPPRRCEQLLACPDDARPITLSNTDAKTLGSALNKALSDKCELGASEAQNGSVRA